MSDVVDLHELDRALNVLAGVSETFRYSKICQFNDVQTQKYVDLLDEFKRTNSLTGKGHHIAKGKSLEALVSFLLSASGDIFEVKENLRNNSNEIDQLFTLNAKGKSLLSKGLINKRLDYFLGECKNYKDSVNVTYTGKFCSLLLSNTVRLGILFSYHGLTGSRWEEASGLVRKFYLHKEKEEERYCIIDFNINDFEEIKNGKNILELIDSKIDALRFDTSYKSFLSPHPVELGEEYVECDED